MAAQVRTKVELYRLIGRFLDDENRGISKALFAELAGISEKTLEEVFQRKNRPMSEYVQIRVNKAYDHWRNGDVAIMERVNRTRFIEYRKQSKPRLKRSYGLQVQDGQIKLKIGISNKADYDESLDDQLSRG